MNEKEILSWLEQLRDSKQEAIRWLNMPNGYRENAEALDGAIQIIKEHRKSAVNGSMGIYPRDDAIYLTINHDIIKNVIRKHHRLKEAYRSCLAIVDRNIAGNESIGASWF